MGSRACEAEKGGLFEFLAGLVLLLNTENLIRFRRGVPFAFFLFTMYSVLCVFLIVLCMFGMLYRCFGCIVL